MDYQKICKDSSSGLDEKEGGHGNYFICIFSSAIECTQLLLVEDPGCHFYVFLNNIFVKKHGSSSEVFC